MPYDFPVEAAVAAIGESLAYVEEIKAALEEHLGIDPDACSWAQAGDCRRVAEALKEVADLVMRRGEYAR